MSLNVLPTYCTLNTSDCYWVVQIIAASRQSRGEYFIINLLFPRTKYAASSAAAAACGIRAAISIFSNRNSYYTVGSTNIDGHHCYVRNH